MDLLNNINVIIGIIIGLFGIVGYIFGIISYWRNRVASSQRKQTMQLHSSQKQLSYRVVSQSLSRLDWMEVLWNGFEDCIRAREGAGWINAVGVGVIGGLVTYMISSAVALNIVYLSLAIFYIIFSLITLLFYVYFVGRRIEKKIESMNRPFAKKPKSIQSHERHF